MAKFTKEQIRQRMMDRKRSMQKLEIELLGLEDLNGELAVQALTPGDYDDADKLSKDKDGNEDPMLEGGVLIARSLVMYATKERLFEDTDAEWMKQEWETNVYVPLVYAVREFSGISEEAYENAKKNYRQTQGNGSATSSESNSEAPGQSKK
jgi:hypothetical protein